MSGVGFGMVVAAAVLGLRVVLAHLSEEEESNASWLRLQIRLFQPLAIGMAAIGLVLMANQCVALNPNCRSALADVSALGT